MAAACRAVGLGILLWMSVAQAQTEGAQSKTVPPSTMEMTIVGTPLQASDGMIYINEDCEVFPGLILSAADKKRPRGEWIPDVCHLENVLDSKHHEETPAGNETERSDVEIREQEYVLQNITLRPAVFAVLGQVPEGWRVDSDPPPTRMDGNVAIFEVHADPGETVRLHVGIRHTREMKARALPACRAE